MSASIHHIYLRQVVTFTDLDYRLGFNAVQTTLGALGKLAGMSIVPKS